MDYPEDFDTSAFPAGKRIAVSRTAGIWVMVSMFLVVVCAIALPWVQKNQKIDPMVIYVDAPRGQWELLKNHDTDADAKQDLPYYHRLQRSLAGVFTEKWFTLSDNRDANSKMWSRCSRATECAEQTVNTFPNPQGCDIYCMSDDELYGNFVNSVLPMYETAISFGEKWRVRPTRMVIEPNGEIAKNGGEWVVRTHVYSSNGEFDVIAYVTVKKSDSGHPQTLGYYVSDFKSYRER